MIKKLSLCLRRSSLLKVYKSFVKLHLDYVDVIYNQPKSYGLSVQNKSVQSNWCPLWETQKINLISISDLNL